MKKLIILISLVVVAMTANSQTVTIPLVDNNYVSTLTDYSITNTTPRVIIFDARGCDWSTKQDFLFQLDSVSGNHTNVAIALAGAKFATGAYSTIGSTINWKGTTSDTTIIISNASATLWNFFKVTIIGTGTGVSKVDANEIKMWNQ